MSSNLDRLDPPLPASLESLKFDPNSSATVLALMAELLDVPSLTGSREAAPDATGASLIANTAVARLTVSSE